MKKLRTISLFALACTIVALAGCHGIVECPASVFVELTRPETVTIKVGAATIAIAGSTYRGCEVNPPRREFVWVTSDPTIVSVTTLDSIHASILGLRPGAASVTPRYRVDSAQVSPSPVLVTVVP